MARPLVQDLSIGLAAFEAALRLRRGDGPIAVALDLETDSLRVQDAEVIWLSWCLGDRSFGAIPVHHRQPRGRNETLAEVKRIVKAIHDDPAATVVWHNAGYDLSVLTMRGWLDLAQIKAKLFDTMIASFTLNPIKNREGGNHKLKELYGEIVQEDGDPPQDNFEVTTGGKGIADAPFNDAAWYAAFDTWTTLRLYHHFKEKIDADGSVASHFYRIEMPHVLTTAEISTSGMCLRPQSAFPMTDLDEEGKNPADLRSIDALRKELQQTITAIFELAGRTFNFSSPDALRRFLFVEGVGLRPQGKSGDTGRHRVDKDALIRAFLDDDTKRHRWKQKLIANILYAKQLTETIKKHEEMYGAVNRRTGKVYSELSAMVASGRFKAKSPNILSMSSSSQIKHHIVPDEGNVFVVADFSQIDLRVIANEAAEMNQDSDMWQAVNAGVDLHFNTLKIVDERAKAKDQWIKIGENARGELAVFDINKHEILLTADDKTLAKSLKKARSDVAKPVNFGVSYGLGAAGLLGNLTVTDDMRDKIISLPARNQSEEDWLAGLESVLHREELTLDDADRFLRKFQEAYPDIEKFQKRVEQDLMASGFTYNLFGRRCRAETVPHLEHVDLDIKLTDRKWCRVQARRLRIDPKHIFCVIEAIHALEVREPLGRKPTIADLEMTPGQQVYGYKPEALTAVLGRWRTSKDQWQLVDDLLLLHADASWDVDDIFDFIKPTEAVDFIRGDSSKAIAGRPLFPFAMIPHRLIKRMVTVDGSELAYIDFDKLRRNLISSRVSSTSMDVCKIAMFTFRERAAVKWPDKAIRPKIINCIHDEIAVECRSEDKDDVKAMLKSTMDDDANYSRFVVPGRKRWVKIRADIKVGKSYARAKP